MKKVLFAVLLLCSALVFSGCAYAFGGSKVDLTQVANDSGLRNVTTGDGTYGDYQATGHYKGMDFGIAVGIPLLTKIVEIYPIRSAEELLTDVANEAAADGANGMRGLAGRSTWAAAPASSPAPVPAGCGVGSGP